MREEKKRSMWKCGQFTLPPARSITRYEILQKKKKRTNERPDKSSWIS